MASMETGFPSLQSEVQKGELLAVKMLNDSLFFISLFLVCFDHFVFLSHAVSQDLPCVGGGVVTS